MSASEDIVCDPHEQQEYDHAEGEANDVLSAVPRWWWWRATHSLFRATTAAAAAAAAGTLPKRNPYTHHRVSTAVRAAARKYGNTSTPRSKCSSARATAASEVATTSGAPTPRRTVSARGQARAGIPPACCGARPSEGPKSIVCVLPSASAASANSAYAAIRHMPRSQPPHLRLPDSGVPNFNSCCDWFKFYTEAVFGLLLSLRESSQFLSVSFRGLIVLRMWFKTVVAAIVAGVAVAAPEQIQ